MNENKSNDKKYELDHEYDGIRECDYPAPKWWQNIFYASIIWGIGYYFFYSVLGGESLRHRLDRELVEIERVRLQTAASGPTEEDLIQWGKNGENHKAGKEVFASKCASCHGEQGQGLIGPNLTDRYWLHGKGFFTDVFKVVDKGVPDKGMPPWGPILSGNELKSVAVYVKSLQGASPAHPKAPQGVEIKL